MNFEEELDKLNKLVLELENKDLALEEAIKKYEEAMNLSNKCMNILNEAQLKVKKIEDNKIVDFNEGDE